MQVIYDSTRPKGVGQIMSVGSFDFLDTNPLGKAAVWGFAIYGVLSIVDATRPHARTGGFVAAGITFLRSLLG